MWELDHKGAPKNPCFQTVVLKKTFESPLDFKETKTVNPKGNQLWLFIQHQYMYAEAEAPVLWSPDVKGWLIGKDPNAGKDWGQEEKGAAEDEMVRQHHRLNEHEFEQTLGDGEGQKSLAYCSPWGLKESDMTSWLNNNKYEFTVFLLPQFLILLPISLYTSDILASWMTSNKTN